MTSICLPPDVRRHLVVMEISSAGIQLETFGANWPLLSALDGYFRTLELKPSHYGSYFVVPYDGVEDGHYELLRPLNLPLLSICKRAGQENVHLLPLMAMLNPGWYEKLQELWAMDAPFATKQKTMVWYGGLSGPLPVEQNLRRQFVTRAPAMLDRAGLRHDVMFTHLFGRPELATPALGRYEPGFVAPESQIGHKYLVALDGNSYPTNLGWAASVNSLVFRNQSRWRCFLDEFLVAGVDYVEFSPDLSDFEERVRFVLENEALAEQIVGHATDSMRSMTPKSVGERALAALIRCQDEMRRRD
jgi:hypothetical protein